MLITKEENQKKNLRNGDLNYEQTEYLGTEHSEELQIDGNTIPPVIEFEYLGSIFQENGSSDLEFEERIGETRKVISMLMRYYGIEIFYTQQSYYYANQ
jgi:hypothetical protein